MSTLTQDFSFLKLYKTLDEAIVNEMPSVTKLPEWRFIQQLPNEKFRQITNSETGVGFVGGFTAELVNCQNEVQHDISSNFYYEQVIDANGLNQIAFEFGATGIDEPAKFFFLKLTDTTNQEVWYSYPFMITSYNWEISMRLDYYSKVKKFGISYDLFETSQSIRIANCYQDRPANKKELTQYVVSDGHQVNFDSRPTLLKVFKASRIDDFINDRLDIAFSHEFVYINGIRAMVSDFKVTERKGDTNWLMDSEFTVNFQNERFQDINTVYQDLQPITRFVPNLSVHSKATIKDVIHYLTFNKNIDLPVGSDAKLYLDGVLHETITDPLKLYVTGTQLFMKFDEFQQVEANITLGEYSIVPPSVNELNGVDSWTAFALNDWTFTVQEGDYDNNDYDTSDYLTNP